MTTCRMVLLLLCFSLELADVLVLPKSAAAQRHGEVSSAPCPYDCRAAGIPKADCRDWRYGNTCFVEDLRSPGSTGSPESGSTDGGFGMGANNLGLNPRNAGRPAQPVQRTPDNQRSGDSGWDWSQNSGRPHGTDGITPGGFDAWSGGNGSGVGECDHLSPGEIQRPKVYISKVIPAGGFLGNQWRVSGTVEGVCLADAGYFENGEKIETISVRAQRRFQRYQFDVKGTAARNAEVRVRNTAGDEDSAAVNPMRDWGSQNNGGFGRRTTTPGGYRW